MEIKETPEIANKKRFLKRYRKNLNCIIRLEEKLKFLDIKLKTVRSPNLSSMPRGGQSVTLADMTADKIDLENRIERLKERGRALRRETLEEIDTLDDPRYVAILEGFFIDCLPVEVIAENEGYTVRHVYSLYHDAVKALALK